MNNSKKYIQHLGKTFTTTHHQSDLSDKKCKKIRKMFFKKGDIEDVKKEMVRLYEKNGLKIPNTYNYFFYELMAECKLSTQSWSIKEFIQSNDLIRFAYAKMKAFPKVFPTHYTDIKNIKAVFRLSPSGTASKLSNFPYKEAKLIIDKYNTNDNYFDFSCGWGVRLLASLSNDVNYFGVDPNKPLVKKLNKMSKLYKENTECTSQGSEVYVKEWKNTMGLAFSSPPYFTLEKYGIAGDGQSISNNTTYEEWLEHYWKPTVKNIKKYLVKDGNFLLNIKNIKGYALLDDMQLIIEHEGFVHIDSFSLKNINRIILIQNNKNTDEQVLVFKKKDM